MGDAPGQEPASGLDRFFNSLFERWGKGWRRVAWYTFCVLGVLALAMLEPKLGELGTHVLEKFSVPEASPSDGEAVPPTQPHSKSAEAPRPLDWTDAAILVGIIGGLLFWRAMFAAETRAAVAAERKDGADRAVAAKNAADEERRNAVAEVEARRAEADRLVGVIDSHAMDLWAIIGFHTNDPVSERYREENRDAVKAAALQLRSDADAGTERAVTAEAEVAKLRADPRTRLIAAIRTLDGLIGPTRQMIDQMNKMKIRAQNAQNANDPAEHEALGVAKIEARKSQHENWHAIVGAIRKLIRPGASILHDLPGPPENHWNGPGEWSHREQISWSLHNWLVTYAKEPGRLTEADLADPA